MRKTAVLLGFLGLAVPTAKCVRLGTPATSTWLELAGASVLKASG
jgi:hypothetical protein